MTSHDSYQKGVLRRLLAPTLVAGLAFGCAPAKSGGGGGGSGDSSSSGGSSSGGQSSSSSSGNSSSSGGSSSGGQSSSSSSSAGSSSSSQSSGGSSSSSKAGSSGGTSSGGTSSGGSSSGGTGGSSSASSGGSTASGDRPAGYWKMSDWGVTKVDWKGCVWTGKDSGIAGSDTSVSPVDFMTGTPNGGPYKMSGSVFNDYNAVALLGFNLNEDPNGKADQCKNDPDSAKKDGPPTVTMPPSGATGIAINWTAAKLPLTFRIQIQGVKGGSDANNRWCATIKDASGPSFVPFADFNTTCWDNKGNAYKNEPIDAVSFLVPGTTTAKSPYDITINGFAPGNSKDDAPGKKAECGTKSGTLGSSSLLSDATKAKDASSARAATQGKDCQTYIVNNNNWGQPTTTYQQISYQGNSFKIDAANGTASGQGVPASFPSIYVGANGNIASGAFNTWDNTGLPKAISGITSAKTTFKWSGKSSGDFNVCYDIWFAKNKPTAGGYDDGISGLLMVWLYKPGSRQPIGSVKRQANIGGQEYDVWVGPRNTAASGVDNAGRPVVSYVAKSTISSFSADLKAFFDDAVKNGEADKSAGGTSQAFANDWQLTDVFAGFELWSAGDGVGLRADEFTFALNK